MQYISPKPKKSSGNTRKFNLRSSYETSNSSTLNSNKFEEVANQRSFPTSTKNINDFHRSFNEIQSSELTNKDLFKSQSDGAASLERKLNFCMFDEFDKNLTETSSSDEIFSILNDNNSIRSSFFEQEELKQGVFPGFQSYPESRPENPAFRNFQSNNDFIESIRKSLTEDFCEV